MQTYSQQDVSCQNDARVSPVSRQDVSQINLELHEVKLAKAPFLYAIWQKAIDLIFGLCGLIILLILLPFLAICIYLDSPGPIFYHQERVGYRGRNFSMHKFRSMHPNTDSAGSPVWRTGNGSQVTRVGRFLRSTHLDELPQIINILCGEMSLIGPRPERPIYVVELEKADARYRSRFLVKPGLTGWAQVRYGYGESYQDELIKLQYDLYYIEHRSYSLDLRIIGKTFVEVIRSCGDK